MARGRHEAQSIRKLLADCSPIVLRGQSSSSGPVTLAKFRVAQQHYHTVGETRGVVGEDNVLALMHIEPFGADRSRDHSLAHCHGFVNLETCASANSQGDNDYTGFAQVIYDRRSPSGHLNGIRPQVQDAGIAITSDDSKFSFRNLRQNGWPNS